MKIIEERLCLLIYLENPLKNADGLSVSKMLYNHICVFFPTINLNQVGIYIPINIYKQRNRKM